MKRFRFVWALKPVRYSPRQVTFIDAVDMGAAMAKLAEHIESMTGFPDFSVFEQEEHRPAPGRIVNPAFDDTTTTTTTDSDHDDEDSVDEHEASEERPGAWSRWLRPRRGDFRTP